MDRGEPLAPARLLVACDLDGDPTEARIRRALPIDEAALRAVAGERIGWVETCGWSARHRRVEAMRQERLGALVLAERPWPEAPAGAVTAALLEGVRAMGLGCLGWSERARLLRARIAAAGERDVTDEGLMAALGDWLGPVAGGLRDAAGLGRLDPHDALAAWIGWDGMRRVEAAAPAHWTTPTGRRAGIDYAGGAPAVSLGVHAGVGVAGHPRAGGAPMRLELLSPAGRPVAITQDLPGFWAGAYAEVRRDLRGRYPRHPWPDDPAAAPPTTRARPRGA